MKFDSRAFAMTFLGMTSYTGFTYMQKESQGNKTHCAKSYFVLL